MTDKKLKVNGAAYTELSIQIATLEAKVDRILELILNEIEPKQPHWTDEEFREEFK